ncbi:MAG: AsmA-like C-terminal region-containing protein [Hyphomicrobium sp.]
MTTKPTGGRPTASRGARGSPQTGPPPLPPTTVRSMPAGARKPKSGRWSSRFAPFRLSDRARGQLSRRLFRFGRWATYALAPVALLSLAALGVLVVRLKHGPITFDVLASSIERGINAELSDNAVRVKGAELRLGASGGLEFRLRDLTVLEGDGDVLMHAPLAAVAISTSALWRARVVPERIELIDAQVSLVYTDDAGLVIDRSAPPPADGATPATTTIAPSTPPPSVNLPKMLSDASKRARRRVGATSYLTEFALTNAAVVVQYAGQESRWRIADASVDLNHGRRRSVISGRATIDSQYGPWAFSFLTDESEKTDTLQVKATVRDFVPAALGAAAPPFALLKMFQLPIAGDATVKLSTLGDIESADLAVEAKAGRIAHPELKQPFELTGGLLRLTFDGKERRWKLEPSPMKWADGSMLFTGEMRDVAADAGQPPTWRFALDGKNGVMEAPAFGVAPVTLDAWTVEGALVPRRGLVEISKFRMAGGGGEAVATATTQVGPKGQSTRADVKISAMPLATLKALWPRALAPAARQWVGENVSATEFKGGAILLLTGDYLAKESPADSARGERLSASFQALNSTFAPMTGMAPIVAPRGLVSLENDVLEVTAPDAAVVLPGDRKVPLKGARLYSPNVDPDRPDGEVTFSTQAALGPFLEAVEQLPMRAVRDAAPFPKAADGKVDAQFKIKLPLAGKVSPDEVTVEGKARIADGRFGKIAGQFDVQGFTLNLDLTPDTLNASGDLLVNGVPAKIAGQRMLGPAAGEQPPIKITANLDETDRTQLGLDVNDVVRGVAAIEISYQKGDLPEPAIKLKADLTQSEIVIEPLAWRKASGRSAALEADLVAGKGQNKSELQNFRISGDDIAVEGWLGVGADNRLTEFYFPTFALNVVSRLEVQGSLRKDNVWDIKANGPTFDGRDLFRSMFQVGAAPEPKSKPSKSSRGVDVAAEVSTVLGASETSLRGLKIKLSKRDGNLTALDIRGGMDGGATVAAALDPSRGARRLVVDSVDAGQVLKLVDFYPNMQGGLLKLEINLDGKGAAEKTGTLWVDQFKVLGDPVVSEVFSGADPGKPAISAGGQRNVTREVFEFDRMRAPFSIGYGQFVLEDAYMKGPLVGASVRGKVDFKTRKINLGGSYIPLNGLNSAFGGIPIFGQLISGAQGEGIFGITFAVQGPLADPQVIVNPLSIVAPGIFREIFQMTAANPQVQVREEKAPAKPASERVRAAPPGDAGVSRPPSKTEKPARAAAGEPVDGWSSTTPPPKPKSKN